MVLAHTCLPSRALSRRDANKSNSDFTILIIDTFREQARPCSPALSIIQNGRNQQQNPLYWRAILGQVLLWTSQTVDMLPLVPPWGMMRNLTTHGTWASLSVADASTFG